MSNWRTLSHRRREDAVCALTHRVAALFYVKWRHGRHF